MPDEPQFEVPTGAALTDDALRSAVDAAPDGIVVVDAQGTIVFVNPMVGQLFGYASDELVGMSVDRLLPSGAQPEHGAHRADYIDNPRPRTMGSGLDLRGRSKSGTEFPVEISLSPLLRENRRTLVIAVVRDVTERRAAEGELERARAELALVDERERIARDLHDTVIQRLFAVGLSLQGALTRAGAGPTAEPIQRAVDDIDETIRDLRSAIFSLHTRRPGGASLRDDVITLAHEAARALGFEPRVVFDGPVDSAASDDMHAHLVSTLREALSNVAKHAHATAVDIGVVMIDDHLVLSVSDNGRGIAVDAATGSGLANIRERAEQIGGACAVSSRGSGSGTHIEWRVPINRAPRD